MAASKKTSSATKASAKKAPAKKAAAKKPAATKASATKAPAKKTAPKTADAVKSPAKKASAKKAPATKSAAKKSAAKKAPAKKAPAKKAPAKKAPTTKAAPKNAPARKASDETTVTKPAAAAKKTPIAPAARKPRQPGVTSLTPSLLSNATFERVEIPAPRGRTKDGIAYTKDFDVKFLKEQRDELLARRASELARATRLEDEATSIIEDGEMGDVQFDDEGGEGDTMVVQRDLDRVLSTQARQTILEIDAALAKIEQGTYGYSEVSGMPIPRERLEAIPETTVLAAEKVSGVGPR
jgi:RNA polymerase-binding transcription factor DksA